MCSPYFAFGRLKGQSDSGKGTYESPSVNPGQAETLCAEHRRGPPRVACGAPSSGCAGYDWVGLKA